MDNRPIGIFDSGLGGLTVVKELESILPNESIVYFGDTARIPYGTRSKEIVSKYSEQCVRFLMTKGVKMAVVACNTASSSSLDILNDKFDFPVIGVIKPGAKAAVKATTNKLIGILGTAGTIKSKAYPNAIKEYDSEIEVLEKACNLFMPIVEEGWSNTEVARLTAETYLKDMKNQNVNTIVLGCTHYPLLSNTISKVMGEGVTLINPAEGTAQETKNILAHNSMLRTSAEPPSISFYVSDFGQNFKIIGSHFLNMEIDAKCIDIEKY